MEDVLEWSKQSLPESGLLSTHLHTTHPNLSLPVIRRGTSDLLTLEFETAGPVARSLSVAFHRATRNWERTDQPEPLPLPFPDEIVDYENSEDKDFPYVSYTYEFPNPRVNFERSGNYILEVSDSDTKEKLFERRFYVTGSDLDFVLQASSWSLITEDPDELRPEVRVDLPVDPWYSPGDCTVCFIKNGWVDEVLCAAHPQIEGPIYIYRPDTRFRPTIPVLQADLNAEGRPVLRRDDFTVPETVILFPDDPRLAAQNYSFSSPIPRNLGMSTDLSIPIVNVEFSLTDAPPKSGEGGPYLVGSFSDWVIEPRYQMQWDDANGVYYLNLLLKKEQIYYAYLWEDASRIPSGGKFEGPGEVSFTAFIYVRDSRYPTERLLGVKSTQIRR